MMGDLRLPPRAGFLLPAQIGSGAITTNRGPTAGRTWALRQAATWARISGGCGVWTSCTAAISAMWSMGLAIVGTERSLENYS